ncbi:MAG: efflux RND transporter permease subunit, partial [Kiritimatiellae bacterium]|nr:efflux RND transporter permease subunit [Kiritimatiellia bacterium]
MHTFFDFLVRHAKGLLLLLIGLATFGFFTWQRLAVDVFPDVSMPRVTIQTEAGGLTAEEVEQLVTIPIESAVNGIPGVRTIRSSSSGGLSFVWVDFDWDVPLTQARFDVFERLSRVQALLPEEAHAEMSPVVSVTGE